MHPFMKACIALGSFGFSLVPMYLIPNFKHPSLLPELQDCVKSLKLLFLAELIVFMNSGSGLNSLKPSPKTKVPRKRMAINLLKKSEAASMPLLMESAASLNVFFIGLSEAPSRPSRLKPINAPRPTPIKSKTVNTNAPNMKAAITPIAIPIFNPLLPKKDPIMGGRQCKRAIMITMGGSV